MALLGLAWLWFSNRSGLKQVFTVETVSILVLAAAQNTMERAETCGKVTLHICCNC